MRRGVVVPAVLLGGVAVMVAAAMFLAPRVERFRATRQQAAQVALGYAAQTLPPGSLGESRVEVRPGDQWMVLFRGLDLPCNEVGWCETSRGRGVPPPRDGAAPVVRDVYVCLTPPAAPAGDWRFAGAGTAWLPVGPSNLCDRMADAVAVANPSGPGPAGR